MTTRKATNTSEAIHITVRLASASTCGLGPRLGLNLWRRFCGPFACDDLFPVAMAAVSFEMVDFATLIYAVSRAREVFLVGTHWRGFPIKGNTASKHEKVRQVPWSTGYARSTSLLGLSSPRADKQKARPPPLDPIREASDARKQPPFKVLKAKRTKVIRRPHRRRGSPLLIPILVKPVGDLPHGMLRNPRSAAINHVLDDNAKHGRRSPVRAWSI